MRRGTGYTYSEGEDCISYKCEGCGRRVQVTPTQAQQFRGAFTACSKSCVLKARDFRTQQAQRDRHVTRPSESEARAHAQGEEDQAAGESAPVR